MPSFWDVSSGPFGISWWPSIQVLAWVNPAYFPKTSQGQPGVATSLGSHQKTVCKTEPEDSCWEPCLGHCRSGTEPSPSGISDASFFFCSASKNTKIKQGDQSSTRNGHCKKGSWSGRCPRRGVLRVMTNSAARTKHISYHKGICFPSLPPFGEACFLSPLSETQAKK